MCKVDISLYLSIVASCIPQSLIGHSGVRALSLAAGINVGGHFFSFLLLSLFLSSGSLLILPEGVVVGIQIFAWAPN